MARRWLPRVDGVATVPWGHCACDRDSVAFNPDTGALLWPNRARISEKRISYLNWKQQLFYTFAEPQIKMSYDATHPAPGSTNYLVGTGGRLERFEAEYGGHFTRATIGTGYLGTRPIYSYLRPKNLATNPLLTKWFVITCVVHGNEVDGLDGAFRAAEILATDSRFQSFRDEWTLCFIPCLNPDGFYLGSRGSGHYDPATGHYANLNRNFDFFWSSYVEEGTEWKGSAPESEPEVEALCDLERSVRAAGGRWGVYVDMHATEAFGARYYTRARLDHFITEGPTEGGEIPDAWVTQKLHEQICRMDRAQAIKRYLETPGGIPYFVRILKSYADPKAHSYFSSLGVYSTVAEEAKVAEVVTGAETIASACNFRLDHILNTAAAVTAANWEYHDAVLVENATLNVMKNSTFEGWNPVEGRPTNWNVRRAHAELVDDPPFADNGQAIKLTSGLAVELPVPASGVSACWAPLWADPATYSGANLFVYFRDGAQGKYLWYSEALKDPATYNTTHGAYYGAAVMCGGSLSADIIGGANLAYFTRIDLAETPPTETRPSATGLPNLRWMGYCDNARDTSATQRFGFMAGGEDNSGNAQQEVYVWDPVTCACVHNHDLPEALVGACMVYVPGTPPNIYLFGGINSFGDHRKRIYKWVVSGMNVFNLISAVLPTPLAHMSGYYGEYPYIYLFGGEYELAAACHTYRFDIAIGTITEIFPDQAGSDEEDYSGGESAWTRAISRSAAVLTKTDSSTEGIPALIGGSEGEYDNPIADIYTYDSDNQMFELFGAGICAYLIYNSIVGMGWVVQAGPWSAISGVWEISEFAFHSHSTAAPYATIQLATPEYSNQLVQFGVADGGTSNNIFQIWARATIDGTTVDTGYCLTYKEDTGESGDPQWVLSKYIDGAGGDPLWQRGDAQTDREITGTPQMVQLFVEGSSPVRIKIVLGSGTPVFTGYAYDYGVDRIVDKGNFIGVKVKTSSSGGEVDFTLPLIYASGKDEELFSLSGHIKSDGASTTPYDRLALLPQSSTSLNTTRYISTYYKSAPPNAYVWRKCRASLQEGKHRYVEDGIRVYNRLYKDEQTVYMGGMHLQVGSMVPSSYMPSGTARDDESIDFADVLDPNNFNLRFLFVPTASFLEYSEDQEIARIYADANNYIRLYYQVPTTRSEKWARQYNMAYDFTSQDLSGTYFSNSVGPHDPKLVLEKVRSGAVVASVEMISYFGHSNLAEESCEFNDDPMDVCIVNGPDGVGLTINRAGSEGRKFTAADLAAFSATVGGISYSGVGYFSQPELRDVIYGARGRALPAKRAGIIGRTRQKQRHQLLSGDRDPTLGDGRGSYYYNMGGITYGIGDSFYRDDNLSIGGKWVETFSHYGWGISAYQARCGLSVGLIRWKQFPKHADYAIQVSCSIVMANNIFALIGHWDWWGAQNTNIGGAVLSSELIGYGLEVVALTGSRADVSIVRYFHYSYAVAPTAPEIAANTRTVLATVNIPYTLGTTKTISLSFLGPAITGLVYGTYGLEYTLTATDDNFPEAGYVGLMGNPLPGSGYIYADTFAMVPNFTNTYE